VNKARSDFLFATPSFIYGAARVLDLYGIFDAYNSSSTEYEADCKAIWSDSSIVGQDICFAMKQLNAHCLTVVLPATMNSADLTSR